MKVITFFAKDPNSSLLLNICASLARNKQRVLYIDARYDKKPQKNLSTIYSAFSQSNSLEKSLISLEPNLDVLYGSSNTYKLDFELFSKFIKGDVVKEYLEGLDYDFIIFEVSPNLTSFTQNIIHVSNQIGAIIDMQTTYNYFLETLVSFLKNYSLMYGKELSLTRILPSFKKDLKKEDYAKLISSYSSQIVTYPINEELKDNEFKEALQEISNQLL